MKPDSYFLPYAEVAFNAYAIKAGYKSRNGSSMPKWEDVGVDLQARWVEAAKAVFRLLEVRDVDTGEPYA